MKQFTIDIKVTQKHIDTATKGDCGKCVIALAVIDAIARLKKVKKSTIEVSTISIDTAFRINKGTSFRASHPNHIYCLVNDFDAGKPIEPTSFTANFVEKQINWR